MARPTMNSAPPNFCAALSLLVVRSRKIGRAALMISARRCFKKTTKSARSSDLRTSPSGGAAVGWELVTDLAPGETDEHVLQGDLTVGDVPNPRIVAVLGDQIPWRLGGEQGAVVDERDSIADRLGLIHRVRGQEDAPAALSEMFDAGP